VELSFQTEELREICEKRAAAVRALGLQAALELERCLADIEAAESVADVEMLYHERVVDHSPHERALRFALEHTLIFRSGHVRTHNLSTGATDWERVTRLRITAIKGTT
jgi:hypothetical protein